jgi:putative FmdB family regulatory protein
MLLHDYKCTKCDHIQEENHKWNEKPEIKCSQCGEDMFKMIGSAGFKLRGEGWFNTTYRGK